MQVIEKSSTSTASLSQGDSGVAGLAETVREETLEALQKAGVIRDVEVDGFRDYLVSNSINTGDILPVMAQLRKIAETEQSAAVVQWARSIAPIIKRRNSLIPFAGKLLSNASLFENYQVVKEACAAVRCPLIFSEDSDVIGYGTINPVAGMHLGEFTKEQIKAQTGTAPYISMFLLDLPTWEMICRRQFGA